MGSDCTPYSLDKGENFSYPILLERGRVLGQEYEIQGKSGH
jgi:hypothetical protein